MNRDHGIFEKKPGSGVWWIRYADEQGKIRRKLVGPKDLAKTLYKRARKKTREVRLFPPPPEVVPVPAPITLDAMIDDVLARTKGILKSWREYERSAKMWKAAFGGRLLAAIVPGDIERWRAAQYAVKNPPKPATINRHLAFLKRVYSLALRDGKCERSPFLTIDFEKENNRRVRFLTDDEETRLCAQLEERDRLTVCIAAYTGMRQGEQFPMRWEQVDFANRVITIPRSKHGEGRIVTLSYAALGFFQRMCALTGTSLYVFPSGTWKSPISATNYSARVFKPAVKRAKIKNFRWHDLRHTYGSRLGMAGVSETEIARLMGHKATAMTQRYVHLSQGHLHDTVEKLDAVAARIHGPAGTSTSTDTESGANI